MISFFTQLNVVIQLHTDKAQKTFFLRVRFAIK